MINPALFALIVTAGLLTSTPLYAADMRQDATTPAQVQMISGGIGDGEIDAMNAQAHNYSVKLVYAEKNGEYLSNVNVQILDSNQQPLVNTSSAGPIVLLNLKPGSYTLVSSTNGDSNTQRISVGGHGLSSYTVHLHSNESQTSSLSPKEG